MVLYHTNGRVVIAHENYLEKMARKLALAHRYEEQIDIYNRQNDAPSVDEVVEIVIEQQYFKTLYADNKLGGVSSCGTWEELPYRNYEEERIRVNRAALIRGSTLAEEHFRMNPASTVLHLPVSWPRMHLSGNTEKEETNKAYYAERIDIPGKIHIRPADAQMAFIRSEEIKSHIVPWLRKVGNLGHSSNDKGKEKEATGPKDVRAKEQELMDPNKENGLHIPIPDALLDKIHLYNTMLQLGLPRFVQRPLVDALILQMYKNPLKRCHLETLEVTVGRFNSHSVAVLDPVICHFIGTFAFRGLSDRRDPVTRPDDREVFPAPPPEAPSTSTAPASALELGDDVDDSDSEQSADEDGALPRPRHVKKTGQMNFTKARRPTLRYIDYPARRSNFPDDTIIIPPELPVLGHSIAHWSGLRANESAVAAFTGFPLNIGESYKFIRRNSRDRLSMDDVRREQTNRLAHQEYYRNNRPGLARRVELPATSGPDAPPNKTNEGGANIQNNGLGNNTITSTGGGDANTQNNEPGKDDTTPTTTTTTTTPDQVTDPTATANSTTGKPVKEPISDILARKKQHNEKKRKKGSDMNAAHDDGPDPKKTKPTGAKTGSNRATGTAAPPRRAGKPKTDVAKKTGVPAQPRHGRDTRANSKALSNREQVEPEEG